MKYVSLACCYLLITLGFSSASAFAQDGTSPEKTSEKPAEKSRSEVAADKDGSSKSSSSSGSSKSSSSAHTALLKGTKSVSGLIPLHYKENRIYAELSSSHYNNEFIVLISLARGIGEGMLLGGMTWGDDWIWTFRKVGDNVHIVRKNVRFKADKGSPESKALANAYTDSVLFSLPAKIKGPKGGDLVDVTSVFMSDLPQISRYLPGFSFSASKSTMAEVKGFDKNSEIEVAATYSSSGRFELETVADSRGATINVHYSISKVPSNGYQPRLADDRVGYFLTVTKDYSKGGTRDQFVRYINRWNLKKAASGDKPSTPKEPIIFWVEKTVPFKYRKPIIDGIREWNKAFEKAGFLEAIEVRQQPDDADWDPEDVNYNTFRWITTGAGFAMGPSRVNPYNGEILDADIIFDADFINFWKQEYERMTPETVAAMTGADNLDWLTDPPVAHRPTGGAVASRLAAPKELFVHPQDHRGCFLTQGMSRQLALGSLAIGAMAPDAKKKDETIEKLIHQGLKEVTMHEVGHTLGLRHNFKASTWMGLKDINNTEKTAQGMVASVMDYNPTNLVPKEWEQGDFYTGTIGPYDYWAIEYGYKSLSGGTKSEVKDLQKIASRNGEPALAYSTDEDLGSSEPDPHVNQFDLGGDILEYAKARGQLVQELIPDLVDRVTEDGDDYAHARQAFNVLLSEYGRSMYFASRYVGGLHTSRSHKGDKGAPPPLAPVEVAKQREAFKLLEDEMFSEKPFQFPHKLYNYLVSSRWNHWGVGFGGRKDFPLHSVISMWQQRALGQLLSYVTLERIHDQELKTSPDQDVLTTAELIERLTKAIYAEVGNLKEGDYTNRKPAIGSLRRNLQRIFLRRLSNMALGNSFAPDDCQTIAYAELSSLQARIEQVLKGNIKLDSYSRAHLQESAHRIDKVLEARLTISRP